MVWHALLSVVLCPRSTVVWLTLLRWPWLLMLRWLLLLLLLLLWCLLRWLLWLPLVLSTLIVLLVVCGPGCSCGISGLLARIVRVWLLLWLVPLWITVAPALLWSTTSIVRGRGAWPRLLVLLLIGRLILLSKLPKLLSVLVTKASWWALGWATGASWPGTTITPGIWAWWRQASLLTDETCSRLYLVRASLDLEQSLPRVGGGLT